MKIITSYNQFLLFVLLTVSLLSVFDMIADDTSMAHAGFIKCPQGADWNRYPICEYEDEWNKSERFNEQVVNEFGKIAEQINTVVVNYDIDNTGNSVDAQQKAATYFADMVSSIRQQVKDDNPRLWDESQRIKNDIRSKLV